jgi:tetratricopeptide (TPR) repeat protein
MVIALLAAARKNVGSGLYRVLPAGEEWTMRDRGLAGALVIGVVLAAMTISARPAPTMADLVAQYARWVNGQARAPDLAAVDLDTARRELARLDPAAIPADPAWSPEQAREMRRRFMTSFALEVAAVGSLRHTSSAARLIEWACAYVRAHAPLNEFDHAWQLAALSVLEGGMDPPTLADHVSHAQRILPDEPRLLLARGIAEEQLDAPSEALADSETAADRQRARAALSGDEGARATERPIVLFQAAARDESVAGEALLRAGHVQLRLGRYDAALATWNGLEGRTPDAALRFLLYLFRGLAYEGRARVDEARQSYKAALALSPRAHSATLRLAVLAFRYGHDDDQAALGEALLKDDDPRRDPWWSYYAGDWRSWYTRIATVRGFLR